MSAKLGLRTISETQKNNDSAKVYFKMATTGVSRPLK